MACDAKNLHVTLVRTNPFCRAEGNDGAVFMLHTMPDVTIWEEVEKVIRLCREAAKLGKLRPSESHMVFHKTRRVLRKGVVNPNVNIQALLSVAVVPKFGRGDPRAVHQLLDIQCPHRRHTTMNLIRHGDRKRPSSFRFRLEVQVEQSDLGGQFLTVAIEHETIDRIDIEQVAFDTRGPRVQNVCMEEPFDARDIVRDMPGMKVLFLQSNSLPLGIHPLNPKHVLGKIPQFISTRTPSGQLQGPVLVGSWKCRREVDALIGHIAGQLVAYPVVGWIHRCLW